MSVAHPGFGKGGCHNRRFGGVVPRRQQIFTVFTQKNSHFGTFFSEKRLAVSAVTMDDAKIFSLLVSKSRSLAKISERKLQPLLV